MSGPTVKLSDLTLGDLLRAVARDEPTPGGGAVSGVVAALAAALAAMAARYAARTPENASWAPALAENADGLIARLLTLAEEDAAAYGRYAEAVRLPREPDPEPRRAALRAALDGAADVPHRLTALAGEIARTGARLAADGSPHLRSDAGAATLLASAVASSAELLVAGNLSRTPGDPRVAEASRNAADAEAAVTTLDHLRPRRTA
jgi:formiminotetrahydrofolate cyclodeaminase